MERIHQMRVVPDLLSSMHPSIDVRITASTLGMVSGKANQIVVPGSFLLPRQVSSIINLIDLLFFSPPQDLYPTKDICECLPYRHTALYPPTSRCR